MTVTPSAVAFAEEALAASQARLLPVRRHTRRGLQVPILGALIAVQVCWLTALAYAVWLIA